MCSTCILCSNSRLAQYPLSQKDVEHFARIVNITLIFFPLFFPLQLKIILKRNMLSN